MKNLFMLALIFFLTANISFAAPNYDPNFKTKIYSTEYNDKLLKKLKDDFRKKYPDILTYDKDGYPVYTVTYTMQQYDNEVTIPYFQQKDNTYHYINE